MSRKDPNLKYRITSDTSDFEKGTARVKKGLMDLDKTSSSVLESLGSAFGVNTQKVEQMTSAIRGLGQNMTKAGSEGVKAFGAVLKSITPLGGAIAGIGIGAAIAGFKGLVAEAENFKTMVAGANMEMATAAYIDTYRQVIHDMNSDTGKAVAETQSRWKKFWGTLGSDIKAFFSSGAFGAAAGGGVMTREAAVQQDMLNKANKAGTDAERLSNEIYDLERKRSDNLEKVAQLNYEIAEQMRLAREPGTSAVDKANARAKALDLVKQKYDILIPIEQGIYDRMKAMGDLAEDTPEEIDKLNQQAVKTLDLQKQQEQEIRTINRLAGGTTTHSAATNKELEQQFEWLDHIGDIIERRDAGRAGLDMLSGGPMNNVSSLLRVNVPTQLIQPSEAEKELYRTTLHAYFERAGMNVHIGFEADTEKLHDITSEVQSLMSNFAETAGSSIGTLIGDLVTGGDAWGNFSTAALSAMGDMAQSVGKIAISTGIATLGIKAALESLNGWAAIAAGTALIALGAAVKAGLSNVAGGNYGASTNVASSSSYSSGNGDYVGREITVKVGGTLEADGNKLIAVINNTNKRNYYTTGG